MKTKALMAIAALLIVALAAFILLTITGHVDITDVRQQLGISIEEEVVTEMESANLATSDAESSVEVNVEVTNEDGGARGDTGVKIDVGRDVALVLIGVIAGGIALWAWLRQGGTLPKVRSKSKSRQ